MLEDREVARLSQELWKLSEFEEQNKERMLEIARVLVDHYMHRDSPLSPNISPWLAKDEKNDEEKESKQKEHS